VTFPFQLFRRRAIFIRFLLRGRWKWRTWKWRTNMHGMKMQDMKLQDMKLQDMTRIDNILLNFSFLFLYCDADTLQQWKCVTW